MTIERRGDGWRARVRRRGHDIQATFDTREDAAAWKAGEVAKIVRGEMPATPDRPTPTASMGIQPVTVGEACRDYVRGMRSGVVRTRRGHRYKPSTTRGVENRLGLYVVYNPISALPIAVMRRGDVLRLVEEVAVTKSPATAANVRDALRLVVARQVDLEVVTENVVAAVRAPTVDHAPARFLEPAEADVIQATADDHDHPCIGTLVALALGTGLRLGELQALVWGREGVDLDGCRVLVKATRDRTGELLEPKSRRTREVPLGADLIARLRRFRMASPRSADGDTVFYRHHRRAWEQVRTKAKIPTLRIHDLRHTCATFWLAAGLSVHAVGELLGHADAALVLRLYGHALPAEKSTAADRLEAWREAQRG